MWVLILGTLLLIPIIGVPVFFKFSPFISVGPEGVDAKLHGVEWTSYGVQYPYDYDTGTSTSFSLVSASRPSDIIGWQGNKYDDYAKFNEMVWKRPDPYNPDIQLGECTSIPSYNGNSGGVGGWTTRVDESIVCGVRTRQAEVHEVNTKGDPLGVRGPTEIVWYQWEEKTREEQVGTTTEIEWTRYEAFVVPVDFVVEVSVRALTERASGTFEDLHLWYSLDTVRWYNAFAEPYGSLESNGEAPEGADLKSYNFRGAFPIWAWIDAWDPFVYEDEHGRSIIPSDLPVEMSDYTQISPSIEGSRLTLYHEPNWEYVDMYAKDIVKNDDLLGNVLESEIAYLPDPRFAETVFTPITLTKFGSYTWSDWGYPFVGSQHFYYPTAYLRVRALYVLWGQWIYLWTHQEAEDQGYEWQNKTSVIYTYDSAWNQFWGGVGSLWGNLVNNPFFWLWLTAIGGVIFIMLMVAILGPTGIALITGWLRNKMK